MLSFWSGKPVDGRTCDCHSQPMFFAGIQRVPLLHLRRQREQPAKTKELTRTLVATQLQSLSQPPAEPDGVCMHSQ